MRKTILILLLLRGAAMGQSIQDQKACYEQAHKVVTKPKDKYDPADIKISNHIDARIHTCWAKEFIEYGHPNGVATVVIRESIYNAFEPNQPDDATFYGDLYGENDPAYCLVHGTKCSNLAEFEKLAKQRYGF